LLFQGQERAVSAPFTYFADHEPPLSNQVRDGRADFLSQFPCLRDPQARARLPVPSDEGSFRQCQIDWDASTDASNHAWQLHVDLLRLRQSDPVISRAGTSDVTVTASAPTPSILIVRYAKGSGEERLFLLSFAQSTTLRMNDPLLAAPGGQHWSPMWCSDAVQYGGRGCAETFGAGGAWRLQSHCAWLLRNDRAEVTPT
jgi:maltooligosyltrehalose trehalohydrolase